MLKCFYSLNAEFYIFIQTKKINKTTQTTITVIILIYLLGSETANHVNIMQSKFYTHYVF